MEPPTPSGRLRRLAEAVVSPRRRYGRPRRDARGAAAEGPFAVEEATIATAQAALLAGRTSCVALVEAYLARIQRFNGATARTPDGLLGSAIPVADSGQLNALCTLTLRPPARRARGFDDRKARTLTDAADDDPDMPDALEVAQQLDAALQRTGALVGPLHGVVMAVKDQFDTFDLRTTGGADTDWADDRPPRDATFVARLREAGAIIIAKANMGEMASGVPRSAFGGVFSNPYDTLRSPSGSSSGSGSSVAANLCCCAIGGESGSSIRGPASANNLVGIAPTQELVSRDGMLEAGLHTRIGPLCRTVADAAKVLDVIAGYDPRDEMTAFAVGRLPRPLANAAEPAASGGSPRPSWRSA